MQIHQPAIPVVCFLIEKSPQVWGQPTYWAIKAMPTHARPHMYVCVCTYRSRYFEYAKKWG